MGYFINISLQGRPASLFELRRAGKRTSAIFPDAPKTHTPGSRLQGLGRRSYNPTLGRWVSRDPIGEKGFLVARAHRPSYEPAGLWSVAPESLYLLVENAPTDRIDVNGLQSNGSDGSDGSPGGGTQDEKCCVIQATGGYGLGTVNLIHSLAARAARESAGDLERMFPDVRPPERLVNAFRHCAAACMLSASFGPSVAWDIEECHEPDMPPRERTGDALADAINNAVGNGLGNSSPPPTPGECAVRCLRAMKDNRLSYAL